MTEGCTLGRDLGDLYYLVLAASGNAFKAFERDCVGYTRLNVRI